MVNNWSNQASKYFSFCLRLYYRCHTTSLGLCSSHNWKTTQYGRDGVPTVLSCGLNKTSHKKFRTKLKIILMVHKYLFDIPATL